MKTYKEKAQLFGQQLEFKTGDFSKRNWGNSWHSLCSYRGKLKPAIAHILVRDFSKKGDIVLDPMGGVGTIPLEANLQSRIGVSNDLSLFASVIASAKLNPPQIDDVKVGIIKLSKFIEENKNNFINNEEVRTFGLNKKIADYFHPDTLLEILAARCYFASNHTSSVDVLLMSCMLHILHGNRPYALSRRSHPLTPLAPKGEFVYKNVVDHVRNKVLLMYSKKDFWHWNRGQSYNCDILELPDHLKERADIIITSPPFASSFRFYTQNWMRLWFSGWTENDFKRADDHYFDNKQNENMDIYLDYFRVCSEMLKDDGKMILHLGKSKNVNMAEELTRRCTDYFKVIHLTEENVEGSESQGIVDKGATTDHQFLFLQRK